MSVLMRVKGRRLYTKERIDACKGGGGVYILKSEVIRVKGRSLCTKE